MNLAIDFESPISISIDLLIGGVAALRLNVKRGGPFRGIGLFVLAALLSTILHAPFIDMETFWRGGFLPSAIMLYVVAGLGCYMGKKLEWDHFEVGY